MPPVRPAAGDKIQKTTFRLGLEELECVLIFSKKRKKTLSYAIRYEKTAEDEDDDDKIVSHGKEPVIFVRVPDKMAVKRVLSVLSDNEDNLKDLLEKARQKEKAVETTLKKTYTNGSLFHYLGRTYSLKLFFDETKKISVHLLDGQLQVYLPSRLNTLSDSERERQIKKAIDTFYIEQADTYFNARADYFSQKYLPLLGSRPKSVKTTFYKGKWGCCTYDNHIKLNWVLIQADTRIIDYIIIHELCHIRWKDHSANFWALVEQMDPHYKEKRQELKENGWVLGIK